MIARHGMKRSMKKILAPRFQDADWDKIKHDDFGPEHHDSLLNEKSNPRSGVWAELDRH